MHGDGGECNCRQRWYLVVMVISGSGSGGGIYSRKNDDHVKFASVICASVTLLLTEKIIKETLAV